MTRAEVGRTLDETARQAAALKENSIALYRSVESAHARADALHQRVRAVNAKGKKRPS